MTGRYLAAVRAAWGLALLVAPDRVLTLLAGGGGTALGAGVVRVLGVRQLLQAGVTAVAPTAGVLKAGAVVDALHAASGVAYAALDTRERRVGLLDAGIAAGFAAASLSAAAS
jgi:hypothetical protein